MKSFYAICLLIVITVAVPAFAHDIAEENPATVAEFASSMEHVGTQYCAACGKYVYTKGTIADGATINVNGGPVTPIDAKGAKSIR